MDVKLNRAKRSTNPFFLMTCNDDFLLTYSVNIMYCIIKKAKTTPNVNASNLSFNSASGNLTYYIVIIINYN